MKYIFIPGFALMLFMFCSYIYQRPDLHTDLSVEFPEFVLESSPRVMFDEGRNNFHSLESTYAPFANLLKNDGIRVQPHYSNFNCDVLKDVDLLIIANAQSVTTSSAFTSEEINTLDEWV